MSFKAMQNLEDQLFPLLKNVLSQNIKQVLGSQPFKGEPKRVFGFNDKLSVGTSIEGP